MSASKCLKEDDCKHKNEDGYCTLPGCCIYFIDKSEIEDREYHRAVDDGEIK